MKRIVTEKEKQDNIEKMKKFVRENHSEMFNHIKDIERYRFQGATKERKRIMKLIEKMKLDNILKNVLLDEIMKDAKADQNLYK